MRLMFVPYVDSEEQRRGEGHRDALFLAHSPGALALRTVKDKEDQ